MNTENAKRETALENRCPSCTASISFNPTVGKWKCEYCGAEFALEEMQQHSDNASGLDKNIEKEKQETVDTGGYVTYHCDSCGAEIVTDEQTAATFCVYCGATAILKGKLSGEFTPELIIPFKKTKEDSIQAFKSLSKGRLLVPKAFTSENNITKIRGIYIPFWLYDIKTTGDLHMVGTRSMTWTTGNHRHVKTDKYKIVRGGEIIYNSIPVDGSKRFDNDIMSSLEPFNFNEVTKYNHAYLSGFYAERYDENVDELYKRAEQRAINSTIEKFKKDTAGYETVTVESNNFKTTEEKRAYAILPVSMVNIKYKDKMYLFAMNGQTGEFIGNIPLDTQKTIIYSVLIFLVIFIIIIAFSYLLSGAWV